MTRRNGWTEARRRRQAALIRAWRPWTRSTGPRTAEGKAKVARNGYKGGMRQWIRELARVLRSQAKGLEEFQARKSSQDEP
jgi:hypothetical protein